MRRILFDFARERQEANRGNGAYGYASGLSVVVASYSLRLNLLDPDSTPNWPALKRGLLALWSWLYRRLGSK